MCVCCVSNDRVSRYGTKTVNIEWGQSVSDSAMIYAGLIHGLSPLLSYQHDANCVDGEGCLNLISFPCKSVRIYDDICLARPSPSLNIFSIQFIEVLILSHLYVRAIVGN